MTRLVSVQAVCDGCSAAAAIVFCVSHRTVLCTACDTRLHPPNTPIAATHHRVRLVAAVTALPFCDRCDNAPATMYCENDDTSLCDKCDATVHQAVPLSHWRTSIQIPLRDRAVHFRPSRTPSRRIAPSSPPLLQQPSPPTSPSPPPPPPPPPPPRRTQPPPPPHTPSQRTTIPPTTYPKRNAQPSVNTAPPLTPTPTPTPPTTNRSLVAVAAAAAAAAGEMYLLNNVTPTTSATAATCTTTATINPLTSRDPLTLTTTPDPAGVAAAATAAAESAAADVSKRIASSSTTPTPPPTTTPTTTAASTPSPQRVIPSSLPVHPQHPPPNHSSTNDPITHPAPIHKTKSLFSSSSVAATTVTASLPPHAANSVPAPPRKTVSRRKRTSSISAKSQLSNDTHTKVEPDSFEGRTLPPWPVSRDWDKLSPKLEEPIGVTLGLPTALHDPPPRHTTTPRRESEDNQHPPLHLPTTPPRSPPPRPSPVSLPVPADPSYDNNRTDVITGAVASDGGACNDDSEAYGVTNGRRDAFGDVSPDVLIRGDGIGDLDLGRDEFAMFDPIDLSTFDTAGSGVVLSLGDMRSQPLDSDGGGE